MVRGVYFSRKEAEATTLSEALDRYEREISSIKKGYLQEKKRIRAWKIHPLAKSFLATIQGKDIAAWRDARIKSGSSANTVRLDLAVISHLFEIARKEWGMEGLANPVKAIRMPSPPSGRDRSLQPGELEKILESTSEEMNQVICFALETAMRRGGLAGMTWVHFRSQKTNSYVTGYEKRGKENRPSLLRSIGNPQRSVEYPTNRRGSLGYRTGCDFSELCQCLSKSGNFRTSFSRSSA